MTEPVIAYRYQLLETLAQGSFGTTYLAQDTYQPDHPKCVIKQLKPDSNDPKFLEIARRLFEQEARILGNLGSHPRIPKLLSYFEAEQDFFLVQEFIDGTSIAQELSPDKRWPESKVTSFLEECLEILKFVHQLGVIHRDIKPDNLIRQRSDQAVFLLDFGAVKQISRDQTQVAETTIAVGTPGYMPDEQIRGKPHISSDIYALGTIGIYGLTGVRPVVFERSEEDEILWQDKAEVSPALAQILTKMVRRDYRRRYQSVEAVLTDLQALTPEALGASAPHPNGISPADPTAAIPAIEDGVPGMAEPPPTIYQSSAQAPSEQTQVINEQPTNIQAPPEKGTAPVYEASHANQKSRRLLKILLPSTALVGAGIGGFMLWSSNPIGQTTAQLNQLWGQAKYSECIDLGESALSVNANQQLLNPLSKCYLGQATQLAEQNKFADAVQLITKVSDQSTYHLQAQQKLDTWSARLLQDARTRYTVKGDLEQALAWVEQIPSTSVVKSQAQRDAKQWQTQHNVHQQKIETAQKALKEGRAEDAIATVKPIKTPEYWKKRADQVQKEAQTAIARRPAPKTVWQPPRQTATAPAWRAAPPLRQPRRPTYQAPQPPRQRPPAYQAPRPAPPPVHPDPPPKEVVPICPGPLCSE
ncbi:protein kinase [Acaryochloris sp. IP29b_bin.148]|uniref:protein kinase domain-containing protein n=1 Tax=Acaryochloris sp. IP29b_bin.148 TaxID=2969218 RepID=UPI00263507D1|nr:protein kinase [Acaryochloris sp. IP29b_bin.148]